MDDGEARDTSMLLAAFIRLTQTETKVGYKNAKCGVTQTIHKARNDTVTQTDQRVDKQTVTILFYTPLR